MRKELLISAIAAATLISAGLLAGCEKQESTAKAPSPSAYGTPATTPPTTSPAAGANQDAAQTAKSAVETLTKPADKTAVTPPAATTDVPAAAGTDAESVSKAQELMTQATQYIKENKLDLAQKAIDQLDALKPKLPASYQPKIDSIHSAFDAVKKGGDLKDSLKNGLLGK